MLCVAPPKDSNTMLQARASTKQRNVPRKSEWEQILKPVAEELYKNQKLKIKEVVDHLEKQFDYRIT